MNHIDCMAQVRLTDLRRDCVRPEPLRGLNGAQRPLTAWGKPEQLWTLVSRIRLIFRQSVPLEQIRHSLHALAAESERPGGPRDSHRRDRSSL
jgi:hypothetical protein